MTRLARRWTFAVGGIVVALVAAVAGAFAITPLMAKRARVLPAPTGSYAVGRRLYAWTDSARLDPLAPSVSTLREVVVWAWYPADTSGRRERASYLPSEWIRAVGADSRRQRLDLVRGHAFADAPLARAASPYPLLIFSPGLGMLPTRYTALLEEVASHGYIVLAVAHPYSTDPVVFPDGRVVRAGDRRLDPGLTRLVSVLGADLVSVLDRAIEERIKGSELFASVDTSRVGAFGHSFGGASSAEACAIDTRFKAGVDMDGTIFGRAVMSGVKQPFLVMTANSASPLIASVQPPELDEARDARITEQIFYSQSRSAYWLKIRGLIHSHFGDDAFFYEPKVWLAELFRARMNGRDTHRIASAYLRAFFGRHLSGVESPQRELVDPPDRRLTLLVHQASP